MVAIGFVLPAMPVAVSVRALSRTMQGCSPAKKLKVVGCHDGGPDDPEVNELQTLPAIGNATPLPQDPHWPHDAPLLDGPRTYEAIAEGDWAAHMLRQASLRHGHLLDVLVDNFSRGIVVTSSYSGIGSDSLAVHAMVYQGVQEGLPLDTLTGIQCYAASDIDATCQRVLLSHTGACRAQHVFGDLCEMAPSQDIGILRYQVARHRAQVEVAASVASPESAREVRKQAIKDEGRAFLSFAQRLCSKWKFSRKDKAMCKRCGTFCRRWPSRAGLALHVEVAGTICVGHSSMGAGWGVLDDATIVCLVWSSMVRNVKPDIVIHECVPAFEPSMLQMLLGPSFSVSSVVFAPTDLGIPSERLRRYSVADHLPSLKVSMPYDLHHFSELCFRRLVVDGNIYFRMPCKELAEALQEMTEQRASSSRGHPLGSQGADAGTWRGQLSFAELARLESHCVVASADFNSKGKVIRMINLNQNVEFSTADTSLIPTLLRRSVIWRLVYAQDLGGTHAGTHTRQFDLTSDRPLQALEHLAVQGVAVPVLLPPAHVMARANPLRRVLAPGALSGVDLRSLAGNMMHLGAVGSVLGFRLMTAQRR